MKCNECDTPKPAISESDNVPYPTSVLPAAGRGRGGGFVPSDGDWSCPNPACSNINVRIILTTHDYYSCCHLLFFMIIVSFQFAKRTECNKCGTPAPLGVGGGRGRGAPGGQSKFGPGGKKREAGDWDCTVCGNVNYGRRNNCNMWYVQIV